MRIVYYSSLPLADCDFPLIKALTDLGHDVYYFISVNSYQLKSTLISIDKQEQINDVFSARKYDAFRDYGDCLDLDKVYVVNSVCKSSLDFRNFFLYCRLIKKIRDLNPDVVHITMPLMRYESLLYIMKNKIVMTVHDPFLHKGEFTLEREYSRKISFKLIKRYILLNNTQVSSFCSHYKIKEKNIKVSRLGAYYNVCKFKSKNVVKKKQILFFGRISPYKGIEYLCEAMVKVHDKIPDLVCVVAGGGMYYFDKSKYENNEYLKFINRYISLEEQSSLFGESLFCVCPYTDATQSGVLSTSYAFQLPVVISDVGALKEYLGDGRYGILVEPRDSDKLAGAICSLVEDDNLRNVFSSNIKYDFENGKNSWIEIAKDYESVYVNLK